MDDLCAHVADPIFGSNLLGHIKLQSTLNIGNVDNHLPRSSWLYHGREHSTSFRPNVFGIICEIKPTFTDIGYGVKHYPTLVLTYPIIRESMISGNFYNQIISLREQIYLELGEPLTNYDVKPWVPLNTDGKIELLVARDCDVLGLTCSNDSSIANELVDDCTTVLSQYLHPGRLEIGAFIEATVELRRIDRGTKVFYSVIADRVTVLAHNIDTSVGLCLDISHPYTVSLPPELWSTILSHVHNCKDVLSFALSAKIMYDIAMPFVDFKLHVRSESETLTYLQHINTYPIPTLQHLHTIAFEPLEAARLMPYEDCHVCPNVVECNHNFNGVFTLWTNILPLFASLQRIEMSFVHVGVAVYHALSNLHNPFTLVITDCVIPLPPIQVPINIHCNNLVMAHNHWEVIIHRSHSFDLSFVELCESVTHLDLTFDARIHSFFLTLTTVPHLPPLTTTLRNLTLRSTSNSPTVLRSFIDSMLAAVSPNIVEIDIVVEPDNFKVGLPTNFSPLTMASHLTTLSLKVDNNIGAFPFLPQLKHLVINVTTDPSYMLHLIPTFLPGLCHLEVGMFQTDSYLVSSIGLIRRPIS
ncbi:hypothetical protein C8J55DRAFT_563047 [Lentinula edodes]|uniref:F-box domain-containing protein n=1 Tax=Lentinula lateritia TaxID=40482 RepID=A0A9W9DIW5_9AGAR|nr:hypothetical protein C8J55DRAFT_563047 [Lentinula edodes]